MEVAVVAARVQELGRHVRRLRLEFLYADEVGVLRGHPLEKALGGCRTDAVQVGGDDFWHGRVLKKECLKMRQNFGMR